MERLSSALTAKGLCSDLDTGQLLSSVDLLPVCWRNETD